MRKTVRIKFQNGINSQIAINEILNDLTDTFDFVESENPDFILFGPYGNDIPSKSDKYVRIGYFCENIIPDLSICEWAFGVPLESEIKSSKYKRIQWHGFNPKTLIKDLTDNKIDQIVSQKTKFCNFLYSHPVPYREEFFRQLSKYKKVDAPGKSMNNMPSIDQLYSGNIWERKRAFLSPYKFTIAFENYVYPGYQTEKLYDAMLTYSLPIYCGDPCIHEIFNTESFINCADYIEINNSSTVKFLEKNAQLAFNDILPQYHHSLSDRLRRKAKAFARGLKMRMQFNRLNFSSLIDRIIEIDRDEELYKKYLLEPWFNHNRVSEQTSLKQRWVEIFDNEYQ